MLTVTLTALALTAACIIVWFAARRTRVVQRVSTRLSGPVEQMQEQIMMTADTAVDHLDGKMAQMEILLSEIDRRSALLAQQSKQLQLQQLQLEQQQPIENLLDKHLNGLFLGVHLQFRYQSLNRDHARYQYMGIQQLIFSIQLVRTHHALAHFVPSFVL